MGWLVENIKTVQALYWARVLEVAIYAYGKRGLANHLSGTNDPLSTDRTRLECYSLQYQIAKLEL